MAQKFTDADKVSEKELVEAVQNVLAKDHDEENPQVHDTDPTPPGFYTETDPAKDAPVVEPGDPGTYVGDYAPTYEDGIENSDNREDLQAQFEDKDIDAGEIRP